MAKLTWTNENPTEEGWYWIDINLFGEQINEIVEVFYRPGHKYLCISDPNSCQHTKRNFIFIAKIPALWAGPIDKPESKTPYVIMQMDFWKRDLDDIERDFLPDGKKITDMPLQHSINGIPLKNIK